MIFHLMIQTHLFHCKKILEEVFVMQLFFSRIVSILLFGFLIFSSGCISLSQKEIISKTISISPQSSSIPFSGNTSDRYWIRIDPIKDFKTDSTFNISGSTMLNITGTTDIPSGELLHLSILEENRSRSVIRTDIPIQSNNSGPNIFSYNYNMKGNSPGQYRVALKSDATPRGEYVSFAITTDTPYLKWIQMNPLGKVKSGGSLLVSGTTDLPAGGEIMVQARIDSHSCTIATPDRFGARTLCGGSCRNTGSQEIIRIAEGTGGINIWNSSVNTSDWCFGEGYVIGAYAVNWTNVTPGGQYFEF